MNKSTWQGGLGALLIVFAALGCTVAVVGGCDGEEGEIWDFLLDSSEDDNGSTENGESADNGSTEDETAEDGDGAGDGADEDGDDSEDDSGEEGRVPRTCRIEVQVLENGTNAPLPGINVSFSGHKEYVRDGQVVDIPHSHLGPYYQTTNEDGFQWFEFNYNLGRTNNEYANITAYAYSDELSADSTVVTVYRHTDAATTMEGYADPVIVQHYVMHLGP